MALVLACAVFFYRENLNFIVIAKSIGMGLLLAIPLCFFSTRYIAKQLREAQFVNSGSKTWLVLGPLLGVLLAEFIYNTDFGKELSGAIWPVLGFLISTLLTPLANLIYIYKYERKIGQPVLTAPDVSRTDSSWIKRLWAGDVSLKKMFWLWGVFGVGVLNLLTWLLPKIPGSSHAVIRGVLLVTICYTILVSVGTWRSAGREISGSRKFWGRSSLAVYWSPILWGLGALLYFVLQFATSSSDTIASVLNNIKYDTSMPYIGFWKQDCAQNFGLAVERADTNLYYVRFCGPGGCFPKSRMFRTPIVGDEKYKIFNADLFGVQSPSGGGWFASEAKIDPKAIQMKDGYMVFKRCTPTNG